MSKQPITPIAAADGAALLNAFRLVSVGVDTKATRPIHAHILVAITQDKTIELRSYRTGSSLKYTTKAEHVWQPHTFTLSAVEFSKRTNALRGRVELGVLGNHIVFSSGNLQFAMDTLDAEDFPIDVTTTMQPLASFSSEEFARYLRLTSATIDKRYHLAIGGLWLRTQGDKLVLASVAEALGGTRCEVPAIVQGEPVNMVIPRPMVNAMMVGLAYGGVSTTVELFETPAKNQLGIRVGEAFVSGQALGWEQFPNIDQFLTQEIVSSCQVPRQDLVSILGFIANTWTRKDTPARAAFQFSREKLVVYNPVERTTTMDISSELHGAPTTIQLNAKQVRSTVADLRADVVNLGISSKGYVVITDPSDAKYIHVAMPFFGTWVADEADESEVEDVPLDIAA